MVINIHEGARPYFDMDRTDKVAALIELTAGIELENAHQIARVVLTFLENEEE